MDQTSKNLKIDLPILKEKQITLTIKREDLLHPLISGNKFRKLKYNVTRAKELERTQLLTFGGAYSNHILATAAAGKEYGLSTIGVIRGEELKSKLEEVLVANPTLKQAHELGMRFEFVSRTYYKRKSEPEFLTVLQKKYPNAFIVPEGGTNHYAIKGCEEILTESDQEFSHICCAIGTGGTITGLINSSREGQRILGFPALKGDWVKDEILKLQPNKNNWEIISKYHFGGYAKVPEELVTFVNDFKEKTRVQLDPIYTGKMLFGLIDLISNDRFPKGSNILAIHTGGLQGIAGINQKLRNKGCSELI